MTHDLPVLVEMVLLDLLVVLDRHCCGCLPKTLVHLLHNLLVAIKVAIGVRRTYSWRTGGGDGIQSTVKVRSSKRDFAQQVR
jgi:hypothetical protein